MILENDDRLKECPFCKGKAWLAHVEFNDGDIWYNPQCSKCNAGWNENYETKEEAIEAWNKRQ
jgi:ribosomal protein L37AE/L43A